MYRLISDLVHCLLGTACSLDPCGCTAIGDALLSLGLTVVLATLIGLALSVLMLLFVIIS